MIWKNRMRPWAAALTLLLIGTSSAVLAASNGRLPQSSLAPIYHPTYDLYLERGAAASWNALRAYCKARGTDLYPNGRISAYRTYDQQVEAKRIYGSNAATPGTSNHGWGLAVDLATPAMRTAIDKYGQSFGWAKKWSDASWEWWHIRYRAGVWSGNTPSVNPGPVTPNTPTNIGTATLSRGAQGSRVMALQRALNANGASLTVDGDFGPGTEAAVRAYQRKVGLAADGVAGPLTLRRLGLATT